MGRSELEIGAAVAQADTLVIEIVEPHVQLLALLSSGLSRVCPRAFADGNGGSRAE